MSVFGVIPVDIFPGFSCIRTEYEEIRSKKRARINPRKMQTRITPNTNSFYTVYIRNIRSKRHNILPTRTSFFISSAGKLKSVQEFKLKLFEWLLTDDNHLNIVWLHVAVSTEHDLLQF